MQPKIKQADSSVKGKLQGQRANNRYPRSTLANLAQGGNRQVKHSHRLRSLVGLAQDSLDPTSKFIPQYMKKQIPKARSNTASQLNTIFPKTQLPKRAIPSTVEDNMGDLNGAGDARPMPQKASGAQETDPESGNENQSNLPGGSDLQNTPGAGDAILPNASKSGAEGNTGNKQNEKESIASLDDVMLKLNFLTEAVGKIDGMARDIDKISEGINEIRALQATTTKLSQDMAEVQENVVRLQTSVHAMEEREDETLSNQQMLAKELLEVKKEIQDQKEQQQKENRAELDFEISKVKADQRKNNLILEGVKESSSNSDSATYYQVKSFLKEVLYLRYTAVNMAYRLGRPRSSSAPPRPIFIRFLSMGDRMEVWNARAKLNDHPDGRFILKEDLPPQLRPIMAKLSRVAQIARKYPDKYRNVAIRDYKLSVNGKEYTVDQLELLPNDRSTL